MPPTDIPGTADKFVGEGGTAIPVDAGTFDWARHRKYVLFMMFVTYFLNSVDRNIMNVLQQTIKGEFHLMDWQLGLMTGFAFALFYNTVGIPTARFIDGGAFRTTIIAGGLAVWSVATALCGVAQNFPQLLLARAGVGVGEGAFGPAVVTLISDYYSKTERARAIATYLLGLPAASFIGIYAGGQVAEHYGWRAALMVVGLPGLIVALIIKFTVKEPPRGLSDGKFVRLDAALTIRQVFRTVIKKRTVFHLLIAASLASFCTVGGMVWFPPYLQRAFHLSVGQVAQSWSTLSGLAGMIGSFGAGFLVDRFGSRDPRYYMLFPAAAMLISLPFYVFSTLTGAFWISFVLFLVPATLNNSWIPAALSSTQGLAPLAMRALLSMFVTFAANLVGHGFAPPLIGGLSDIFAGMFGSEEAGLRWALIAAAIFYPWAALHFWLASRSMRQDLEK